MRAIIILYSIAIMFSCNDHNNNLVTEKDQLEKENDSQEKVTESDQKDSIPAAATDSTDTVLVEKAGTHPISLQWISWDKKGAVKVAPVGDGWYSIKGSQENKEGDFLKIDGKIKRVSEKELEFDGIIETKVNYNNGGEACVKNGKQVFAAKGNRKYYRLQHMDNCEGGRVVDYVDIYPGNSSL